MFDARVKEGRLVPHGNASPLQEGDAPASRPSSKWAVAALLALCASGCRSEEPQLGSQTNWLLYCDSSADCGGELECICGTCTLDCSGGASCGSLEDGACVSADSPGAVALCDGKPASTDLCVIKCEDGPCPSGSSCTAGVCSPNTPATTSLTIDPGRRFQALIGFGAGLASTEETLLAHSQADALLDVMFEDSGFEMLRLKNRFEVDAASIPDNAAALAPAGEIIAQATTRIGRSPKIFLYSDTPPASLKANGTRECTDYDVACTLGRNAEGAFDYNGFADYWAASLAAYSAAGIEPDYVSIQSNTDWLPGIAEAEACRLLPKEGLSTVTIASGELVEAEFAGYLEALTAVKAAVASTMSGSFAAPEVGSSVMVDQYANVLDPAEYGALAFHLYGETALSGTRQYLERIGEIADGVGLPVIQSEMEETGLNTAVLVHHTLVTAGGSAYIQRHFIAEGITTDELATQSRALIGVDDDSFRLLPPYHALTHYSRHTGQGWERVEAQFDAGELLASAWIAPDDSALTIVLINPTTSPATVAIHAPGEWANASSRAAVTRTVFDGIERSTDLGVLPETDSVEMPGSSIVTIAFQAP